MSVTTPVMKATPSAVIAVTTPQGGISASISLLLTYNVDDTAVRIPLAVHAFYKPLGGGLTRPNP